MTSQTLRTDSKAIGYHDALGMMMWLMKHADYHEQWPLWSVDYDIVPALLQGQSKIYFDNNQNPVGFVCWAWLDDAAKKQMLDNQGPLAVAQWNSGPHLMVSDFVAPWGHAREMLRDLKNQVFRYNLVFSIGRHRDGSIRKIYYWRGSNYKKATREEQLRLNTKLLPQARRQH